MQLPGELTSRWSKWEKGLPDKVTVPRNRTTRLWGCKWSESCGRCLRCRTTVVRTDPGTGSSQGAVGQARADHTKAGTDLWTHGQQPDPERARRTGRASSNIPALLAGQQRGAALDSGWRQLQAVCRQPGSENPSTPRSIVASRRDSREPSRLRQTSAAEAGM